MNKQLQNSIVSLNHRDGAIEGTGFLASSKYILTCAHIVQEIVNSKDEDILKDLDENKIITVDIKFLITKHVYKARLVKYIPLIKNNTEAKPEDIALLEVIEIKEEDSINFSPLSTNKIDNNTFESFGFSIHKTNVGNWISGKTIGMTNTGLIQINLNDERNFAQAGFSGAPIWDNNDGVVIGIMSRIDKQDKQPYMIPSITILEALPQLAQEIQEQNPYKGLEYFKTADKAYFFGRETESQEIAEKLLKSRVYPLYGASGSGKSSLIFAGIIPVLNKDKNIKVISFRPSKPSSDVFENLVLSFIDIYSKKEGYKRTQEIEAIIKGLKKKNNTKLDSLIADILHDASFNHLVIIIDQFEELYTSTKKDEKTKHLFLDQLLSVIHSGYKVSILISIRADFFPSLLEYEPFTKVIDKSEDKKLGPISEDLIWDIIEEPAILHHVTFQDGLVDTLIQEFKDTDRKLPLLEFTLQRLWEHMEYRTITFDSLQQIEGIGGCLTQYAEGIKDNLRKEEQEHVKKVLLKLIRPGSGAEDTRKVVKLSEFEEGEKETLDKLYKARLVTVGKDEVEITHEILIREWPTLRKWINDNREFLLWEDKVEEDRKDYEEEKGDLLTGKKLLEAKEFLQKYKDDISESLTKYIKKSINDDLIKKIIFWAFIATVFIIIYSILKITIDKDDLLLDTTKELNVTTNQLENELNISQHRTYNNLMNQGYTYLKENAQIKATHVYAQAIKKSTNKTQELKAKVLLENNLNIELIGIFDHNISSFKLDKYTEMKIYKYNNEIFDASITTTNDDNVSYEYEIYYNDSEDYESLYKSSIKSAVFNNNNTKLLLLDKNNTINVINTSSGNTISSVHVDKTIHNAIYDKNETNIICFGKKIFHYNIKSGTEKYSYEHNLSIPIRVLDYDYYNNKLLLDDTNSLSILDLYTQKIFPIEQNKIKTYGESDETRIDEAYLLNDSILFLETGIGATTGYIGLGKVNFDDYKSTEIKGFNDFCFNIGTKKDDDLVIIYCKYRDQGYLKLWNQLDSVEIPHKQGIASVSFSKKMKSLLINSIDGYITLWENISFSDLNLEDRTFKTFFHLNAKHSKFTNNRKHILTFGANTKLWKIKNTLLNLNNDANITFDNYRNLYSSHEILYLHSEVGYLSVDDYLDAFTGTFNDLNYSISLTSDYDLEVSNLKEKETFTLHHDYPFRLVIFNKSSHILSVLNYDDRPRRYDYYDRPANVTLWNLKNKSSKIIRSPNNIDLMSLTKNEKWLLLYNRLFNKVYMWDTENNEKMITMLLLNRTEESNYDSPSIKKLKLDENNFIIYAIDENGGKYQKNLLDGNLSFMKNCYLLKVEVETGTSLDKYGNLKELSKKDWIEKKKLYERVLKTKNDDLCKKSIQENFKKDKK